MRTTTTSQDVLLMMVLAGLLPLCLSACASHKRVPPTTAEVAAVDVSASATANSQAAELLSKGRDKDAEAVIRKAIDANPNYGPLRNNMGLVYFRRNQFYEAATEFDYAMRLMPTLPEPRNNLGLVYERVGRLDDAIASYTKAHELQPQSAQYLGNLLRARVRRGDVDPAMRKQFEALLLRETRPEWVTWARNELARLSLLTGTFPGAAAAPAATGPATTSVLSAPAFPAAPATMPAPMP